MLHLEACLARVPSMADLGINDIVNGPIAHSPDGNPRIGPAFGLPNFWLSEAHSFGVTAAGGAGWQLAQWISEGEPSVDMLGVDPRRFGVTSKNYAKIKNEEASSHVFVNHYPMEERQAARAVKSLPVHSRLDQAGAVWGLALDGNGQIGSLCPERSAKATMLTAAPTGLRRSPVKWPRCASASAYRSLILRQVRSRRARGARLTGWAARQQHPSTSGVDPSGPCTQSFRLNPL